MLHSRCASQEKLSTPSRGFCSHTALVAVAQSFDSDWVRVVLYRIRVSPNELKMKLSQQV